MMEVNQRLNTVSLRNVHGSLVGLDRKWHGLWTKDAKYVQGTANFLPALVKLGARHSDELVQDLN